MTQIPEANRAAGARLSQVRQATGIDDLGMSKLTGLIDDEEERIARQVAGHGLAYLTVDDARDIVRMTKGYGGDAELTHMEEQFVTAIICQVATDFRMHGYHIGSRHGIVISFI